MILPPIIVESMPPAQYDQLNNTIGQLNPDTLAQITNIAEAEMVRTYQEHGLEPPANFLLLTLLSLTMTMMM